MSLKIIIQLASEQEVVEDIGNIIREINKLLEEKKIKVDFVELSGK